MQRIKVELPQLGPLKFRYELWGSEGYYSFDYLLNSSAKEHYWAMMREHAIGWCYGESLPFRPRVDMVALMCEVDGEEQWFHLDPDDFLDIFNGAWSI